jgi:flagellar capping protein FliD
LNLGRGAGQLVTDLITKFTTYGSGSLATALTTITNQNKNLDTQIASGQSRLDQRKITLQNQFARMEQAVSKLKSAASSLAGL